MLNQDVPLTPETTLLLLGAFAVAAVATAALTPLSSAVAKRLGVVDRPGGRRIHQGEIPRLGGVAVFLGLLLGSLSYVFVFGVESLFGLLEKHDLLGFLAPCVIVWGIGLIDDVRGLSPAPRIVAVAIAATMLIQADYVLDTIATPWGPLELGYAAYPLTLLWFVGVTNAFNLVDGIDGLLGTVGICSLVGCALVGIHSGMVGTPMLAFALAGSLLGFLYWNRHPARVFMGDAGSTLVGLTTAALSVKVSRNAYGAIAFHIPLALCALPICETLLTLARRHVRGTPYFSGDSSHIHHVMLNKGLSVRRTVLMLGGFSALMATAAVLSRFWRNTGASLTILVLLVTVVFGLRWLGYVEFRVLWYRIRRDLFRPRPRGIPEVLALINAGDGIALARTTEGLQRALQAAVEQTTFSFIALEMASSSLSPDRWVDCQNPAAENHAEHSTARGLWLCSKEIVDPAADLYDEQLMRLPLPPGSGYLGRLVCHRYAPEGFNAPSLGEVRKYLAEPLGAALQHLLAGAQETSQPVPAASEDEDGLTSEEL